jgi:hypothetical protein
MAICPAGPPKLMKPRFNQNLKACQKGMGPGATIIGSVGAFMQRVAV